MENDLDNTNPVEVDESSQIGMIDLSGLNMSYSIGAQGSPYSTISTSAGSNGTSGTYLYTNGMSNTFGYPSSNFSITSTPATPALNVTGDAEFEGDIKWKGRKLSTLLEKIESRLAILEEADPEKLKKFAALKKAYENYKLLEKLIGDDDGS